MGSAGIHQTKKIKEIEHLNGVQNVEGLYLGTSMNLETFIT